MNAYQPSPQPDENLWLPDDEFYTEPPPSDPEYGRHMRRLGVVLDFEPEDLIANQQGFLSQEQIVQQAARVRRSVWIALTVLSVAALGFGVIGIAWVGMPGLVISALAMVCALALAWLLPHELDSLSDRQVDSTVIRVGHLRALFGRLGADEGDATFSTLKNIELKAPSTIYRVMRANQPYRAYYIRAYRFLNQRIIVSMEPDDDEWDPKPAEKVKGKPKRRRR